MSFGLAGAPRTFQCMMEEVLVDILKAQAFIDNISIRALTFHKLLLLLEKVLNCLKIHYLCLSHKKCIVFTQEITLLGIIISNQEISIDSNRLAAI